MSKRLLLDLMSFSLICCLGEFAAADTINVPVDFLTIQAAIDAAVSGVDEIVVAQGTYNEAIDFLGKAITLRSSSGPALTTIDGNGAFHVVQCVNGEGADTILDGFTITGGNAAGASNPNNQGGGMYNGSSSPTVTNCIFSGNTTTGVSSGGGGMYNFDGSNPIVTNCIFSGNSSSTGGGMFNFFSHPSIANCVFSGNSAGRGGGINNTASNATITNCTFTLNSASFGGGMRNRFSTPILTDCVFSENSGGRGGGMYNEIGSSPSLTNCTFSGNTTGNSPSQHGAGMYNVLNSNPTISNCVFIDNTCPGSNSDGGGIYNIDDCDPTVVNCTFSGNTAGRGGGMYNESSSPIVTNCIFSGNSTTTFHGGGMYNRDQSDPIVTNCMFSGNSANVSGGGMMNSNSNPTVKNCTFSGNSSLVGGGMLNFDSNTMITNSTFSGNTAETGGGIYNSGSNVSVTNCTVSGNNADTDGGGMFNSNDSDTMVNNSILWGNNPDEIFNHDLLIDTATVSFCNITNGLSAGTIDGGGNIDVDPQFITTPSPGVDGMWDGVDDDFGDLRLIIGSLCIDAGNNIFVTELSDLDSNPRIVTCNVDMGAYENQTGCIEPDTDGDGVCDICDTCPGYDDAEPCPIPAVSTWGLIVMTLLLVTIGTVVIGRRRVVES